MDRNRARGPGRRQDAPDVEIALTGRRRAHQHRLVGEPRVQCAAIGLRVDRDRAHAETASRADHAAGDLAAIGNEQALSSMGSYILKMP